MGQGQATGTPTAAWCLPRASPRHGCARSSSHQLGVAYQGFPRPGKPLTTSCQPSEQLFERPGHLLSALLNSELQEDEPFRFKPLVTRSWFSYSLQLLAYLKADHHRAATALAIPMPWRMPSSQHQSTRKKNCDCYRE